MENGRLPAWFDHVLDQSAEIKMDDQMLPTFENSDFCDEVSQVIQPDCLECESLHVSLLGTFCFDDYGLYLFVKCHQCGYVGDCGDSHFFEYYHLQDGMIVHRPID